MKRMLIALIFCQFSLALETLTLSSQVFETASIPQSSHQGPGAFDSYLQMDLPYLPIQGLFRDLQAITSRKLKNRGEAHITVITPPEYFDSLKNFVSIREIETIAHDMSLQSSDFKPLCIGMGKIKIQEKEEETYYAVVESSKLLEIRRAVYRLFLERGGDSKGFNPENFYPHITLGFTSRDLHESDGVIKSKNSCIYSLEVN